MKLAWAQALNATGKKAEDLVESFEALAKSFEGRTEISYQKRDFLIQMMGGICNAIMETEGIAKRTFFLPIEFCHDNAKIPQYAHLTDSGMDVYALDDVTIKPGETVISTYRY